MNAYINVDESGDPGFTTHSSKYYAIALVQIYNRYEIPELVSLRQDLHLAPNYEFHFYKSTSKQKLAFFNAISSIPYTIRAGFLNKSQCSNLYQELNGQKLFVEILAGLVSRASPPELCEDILILDAATDSLRKLLRIRISSICSTTGRPRPFKKIIPGDSSQEDGLQLADMIAGAIRTYMSDQEEEYYRCLDSHIQDLWEVK